MKKISVLGSTGSIGTQTLDVIRQYRDRFEVTALTCGHNVSLLRKQIEEFRPALVCTASEEDAKTLALEFPVTEFVSGEDGLVAAAAQTDADMVVGALLGMMGIKPTLAAIEAGKDIAFY